MPVTIEAFGQLAEITGKAFQLDVTNTDELSAKLETAHTALKNLHYVIAVNKKIVSTNTPLNSSDTIVLLPPFSGG